MPTPPPPGHGVQGQHPGGSDSPVNAGPTGPTAEVPLFGASKVGESPLGTWTRDGEWVEEDPAFAAGKNFLPTPPGWKVALRVNFHGLTSFPSSTFFTYTGSPSGAPGSHCIWEPAHVKVNGATGIIVTDYAGSGASGNWYTGGFGTIAGFKAPLRVRVKEAWKPTIYGLNFIDLLFPKPATIGGQPSFPIGVEADSIEAATIGNNPFSPKTFYNGPVENYLHWGTVLPSGLTASAEPFPNNGPGTRFHYNEAMFTQAEFRTITDGRTVGTMKMPPLAWKYLSTVPHWLGIQCQVYGNTAADAPYPGDPAGAGYPGNGSRNERQIASIEVLVRA